MFLYDTSNYISNIFNLNSILLEIQSDSFLSIIIYSTMKLKQSSNSVKTPFLICTQILQKATIKNNSSSLSCERRPLTLSKNNFKDQYKRKLQLQVKGKTVIQQMLKVVSNKQQEITQVQNKKGFKKQATWFGQPSAIKKRQKIFDSVKTSDHPGLLNFQNTNIFMNPKQHKRFYKILKNHSIKKSKTQYLSDEFITQEEIQKERQLYFLQRKGHFYRTSKTQHIDSNQDTETSLQLFEPRLKYKARPSSGDPMRKYKMSSLMIINKKKSIVDQDINIRKIGNHTNSFVSNEKKYQENNSKNIRKQGKDNPLQTLKKKIIFQKQPIIYKKKGRQISIRTSQGINPWQDEEGKQKNINDDQIHVRL